MNRPLMTQNDASEAFEAMFDPTSPTPNEVHAMAHNGLAKALVVTERLAYLQTLGSAHWLDLRRIRDNMGEIVDILHAITGNQ